MPEPPITAIMVSLIGVPSLFLVSALLGRGRGKCNRLGGGEGKMKNGRGDAVFCGGEGREPSVIYGKTAFGIASATCRYRVGGPCEVFQKPRFSSRALTRWQVSAARLGFEVGKRAIKSGERPCQILRRAVPVGEGKAESRARLHGGKERFGLRAGEDAA